MNSILLNTGILSNGKIRLLECTAVFEINDALIFFEVADARASHCAIDQACQKRIDQIVLTSMGYYNTLFTIRY
jgi:hypothetical protein